MENRKMQSHVYRAHMGAVMIIVGIALAFDLPYVVIGFGIVQLVLSSVYIVITVVKEFKGWT